jgi:transposase
VIPPELVAQIRRLFAVEGWRHNTIARHLGVHHSTVRRALVRSGLSLALPRRPRPSRLDPFVPWLREQLARYPKLAASQLYEMARQRGYRGAPDHFRHRLAELELRPRQAPEAFFALRTLVAEQAQVDWADFGAQPVKGGRRRLLAFLMILSYSRWLFVRFFYDARLSSFLTGHVEAFAAFGGVPRRLLYDNLKSAVLERRGEAIRLHPQLLALADHYRFDPRPVAPYRANEKGRIERAVRYLRTAFFPLRCGCDLQTLNREVDRWCGELAPSRPWPQDRRRTVAQAYREERAHLQALPRESFPCHELVDVTVRRTPYVHFDANRYSIPHDRIDRSLTVAAEREQIRILDRHELVATHPRCWSKGQVVEDPRHLEALWQSKRRARLHRDQDRLLRAVPRAEQLLSALAQRQRRLKTAVDHLLRLLDEHGGEELDAAIAEALAAGSPHPDAVRLVLDRRRHARGQPPPVPVALPDDPRLRELVVTPHRLADYDHQTDEPNEDKDSRDKQDPQREES